SCAGREEYVVTRKDLVRAVYASGEVLPVHFYEVTSKIPGIVDSIYVSVGQKVNAGDALLEIQTQVNQLNLITAKALFEQAKQNASEHSDRLTTLEQKIEAAYAIYQQDSLDYERQHRLKKQNIGTEQAFELARLRYQTSRSNYIIAKRTLQETRDQLQIELKSARNNYLAQQSMLGDYKVVASISGKIYDIKPKTGEFVSSSRPVIDLGAAESFEVEMLVDETDIILITKGQPVVYQLDAVDDTVFHGTVKEIYPRINPVDKTARVVANIDPMDYALYPGMSLEANIIIEEKKNILVVPVEYLALDGTVLVKKGSKKETVKVKTGIRDLKYTEILSGLEENNHIVKP
ncbi:MAG TPA: efflux RND transporter periplasmic adaptor subunit, partial [Chryseosolibacter sp.]